MFTRLSLYTCIEWFLTIADTKNFILRCYPSLTVQGAEISRGWGETVSYCVVHKV